jgi:hypothetical protein
MCEQRRGINERREERMKSGYLESEEKQDKDEE